MPSNAVRFLIGIVIILAFFLAGSALDMARGGDGLAGLLLYPGVIIAGLYNRSALRAFVSSLVATLIAIVPISTALNPGLLGAVSNPNILAVFVIYSVIFSAISAAAGFVSGYLAKRRARKQEPKTGG